VGNTPRPAAVKETPPDEDVYRFARSLAHEIRNPLNALALNLKLIERELSGGPARERLDAALHEVRRLDDLVTAFLRFARPKKPHFHPSDVTSTLRELEAFVAPEAARRGVHVTFDIPPSLPLVTDGDLLKQALLNLVLNSFEAPATNLTVTAETRDGTAVLVVRDDGPGVAEPARAFEPFYSTKETGTGLGLPTARQIVRALGGELTLAPTAAGAAWVITVPLAPA
jgi:two-component system sensor histidine kinase PilS (NtrC family)